jgi:DNA polymerase family A/Bifunctional DNA primase/polymerase, N-terminal/3'-5' exonuclease/Family of unknown function (DUF5906)
VRALQQKEAVVVYAAAARLYLNAGWTGVLPVPPERKFPPPNGFTGETGADPTPEQVAAWVQGLPGHSIAVRVPPGVVVIDVDHYEDKAGATQLEALIAELGPLPLTWASTARGAADGPGLSRQLWFQAPPGRYAAGLGPDIDVLQRHHRYAVVWPSPHAKTGGTYTWYRPDGSVAQPEEIPSRGHLPFLPEAWLNRLREQAPAGYRAAGNRSDGEDLLTSLLNDDRPACAQLTGTLSQAKAALSSVRPGSRHDTMTEHVYHLVQLAAEGHPGLQLVQDALRETWEELVADPARGAEFEDLWLSAARKAVNNPERLLFGTSDPCLRKGQVPATAPVPASVPAQPGSAGEEPGTPLTFRECIGTHEFDPPAGHDDAIARDALARVYPAVRYVLDAGTWLVRSQRERWELSAEDMARMSLSELTQLMDPGDPEADKTTLEGEVLLRKAARYKKLTMSSGTGGVARKMRDIVTVPGSPYALRLTDLDANARILWAGGKAWDLEASAEYPVEADLDPATPHLMTAKYSPVSCETPLWDRFCRAVWPDPEYLEWALNNLAVAFTGYANKSLPILGGEKNRGKTQILVLLMDVLGDYALSADPRLLSGADKAHASVVIALKGSRLAFIDEAPRNGDQAEERLKALTGGGELTGNRMGENPVTFKPSHTLILTTNDDPQLTDEGVRERVRYIPCRGDEAAVRETRTALGGLDGKRWQAEAPGVLAQMMARAGRWMADPSLTYHSSAPLGINAWREITAADQSPVLQWKNDNTLPHQPGTTVGELHENFVTYCRAHGMTKKPPQKAEFSKKLAELGVDGHSDGSVRYRHLQIKPLGWRAGTPSGPVSSCQVSSAVSSVPVPGSSADSRLTAPDSKNESPVRPSDLGKRPVSDTLTPSSSSKEIIEGISKEKVNYGGVENKTGSIGVSPVTRQDPVEAPWDDYAYRSGLELGHGLPLALDPEITPWPPVQANGDTPPGASTPLPPSRPKTPAVKTRKPRMTPEERQERLEAKRAETARLKAEKLAAPLLELGGPIVSLPAIVLRDQTIIPVDAVTARAFLEPMLGELSVDVEHSGYALGHENYRLRLVQLGNETAAVVFDPSDGGSAEVIRWAMAGAQVLHAHNANADLVPLEHAGLCDASVWDRMYDTVILAKITDPSLADSDEAGLKPLARALLGDEYAWAWKCDKLKAEICKTQGWITETVTDTPLEKSGWAQMPFCEAFVRYAASDVLDCAAVARVLGPGVPDWLQEREQQFAKAFRPIALKGTPLDHEHVTELIAKHETEREDARQRVSDTTQGAITNPKSTTEVPQALIALGYDLPRTKPTKSKPEGGLSAAKGVLEPLAGNILEARELYQAGQMTLQELTDVEQRYDPLAADILEYRKHDTALGLLLNPWRALCEHGDGRVRSHIMTIEARTGRTSSRGFNMQQVNRRGGMRACILPEPGCKGISADFNSVEIRVGAALSGDQQMQWLIAQSDLYPERKKEFDFHWRTAITCYGENATKENRYNSKRINFAKMFGSGKQSCANLVGVPLQEVSAAFDAFSAMAPQYDEWDKKMRAFVKQGGRYVEAYSGRPLWMDPKAEWGAGNTAIQGTARELAVDATLRWAAGPWGHCTALIVHDELAVWNIPADQAVAATEYLVQCMETELSGVQIKAEANKPWAAWPDAS